VGDCISSGNLFLIAVKDQEIDILRRLRSGSISEKDLTEIFDRYRDNYRIMFNLVQHPKFPEKLALNIIPQLFSMDLIRVVKNRRANPFVRKRVEIEFMTRYQRLPLGEKLSYLKIAPVQVLNNFIGEKDPRIVDTILSNPECTEELILKFINRKQPRFGFYQVLQDTEWTRRPLIAEAISRDSEAPIKIILEVIPLLNKRLLKRLFQENDTHQIIKNKILEHIQKKYL
jgi:hypothetical protein